MNGSTEVTQDSAISVMESFGEAQTRGEIDVQISTARRYPRDITRFLKTAESLATLNDDIAGSCFYKLKRKEKDGGTKLIEGPSVRFAEIIAATWGHLRVDTRVTHEDDRYVYAQGTAWDLQTNVAIRFETRRRVTGRDGRRYSDDMIAVTANAAAAIGLRNVVFRVVPKAFWDVVYQRAKAVSIGDAKTLAARRQKLLDYFVQKVGVSLERVFAYLEVSGVEDISLEQLEDLHGLATAIKEGDTSIDEAFPPSEKKKTNGDKKKTDEPAAPSPYVSDADRKELWRIAKAAGWTTAETQALLRTRYQVEDANEIPLEHHAAILKDLQEAEGGQ